MKLGNKMFMVAEYRVDCRFGAGQQALLDRGQTLRTTSHHCAASAAGCLTPESQTAGRLRWQLLGRRMWHRPWRSIYQCQVRALTP